MPLSMIEQLVEAAWRDLDARREQVPLVELERALSSRPENRPFTEALAGDGLALIAEFKRCSPSAGLLREGADISEMVDGYQEGGAAALSILTEGSQFGGSLDDLKKARQISSLPILRKDFIVDPYMLMEAAVAGADAVLLIVAALDPDRLALLLNESLALDLDCLVEVHSDRELETALEVGADLIGINNRNLRDLSVDVQTTFELIPDIPVGKTVVSESGVSTLEQIEELERAGVDAVLIGEALMRAQSPAELCRIFNRSEVRQP